MANEPAETPQSNLAAVFYPTQVPVIGFYLKAGSSEKGGSNDVAIFSLSDISPRFLEGVADVVLPPTIDRPEVIHIEIFVELTQYMLYKRTRWIIEYTEVQQREKEFHQPMKSGRWRGELE